MTQSFEDELKRVKENLFGHLKGKKVLLIGIGGGGDIIGTLPTFFNLKRLNVDVCIAGLSWKRKAHDPAPGPRKISEFDHIQQVNDYIGAVCPDTFVSTSNVKHIEADISKILHNDKVFTIDISGGVSLTFEALKDLAFKESIDYFIGIDVGGDVLCVGNEPTIRSPSPDQIMLSILTKFDNSLLGVIGCGSDGELPMKNFYSRLETLNSLGGYLGALAIEKQDFPAIEKVLSTAKTESGVLPLYVAKSLADKEFEDSFFKLNSRFPDNGFDDDFQIVSLRDGTRSGEISSLTAFTLFFKPQIVYQTNKFAFIEEDSNFWEVIEAFHRRGYITGIKEGN